MSYYAVSDLHGNFNIYEQIKSYIKPDDVVFFLGDGGDRGPQPWKTIKTIMDDTQFIYMMGNHEDMLIKALDEYREDNERLGYRFYHLANNGGTSTMEQMLADPDWKHYLKRMRVLPTTLIHKNKSGKTIYLSHSGLYYPGHENPSKDEAVWDRDHLWWPWPDGDDWVAVHGHTPVQIVPELFPDDETYRTLQKNDEAPVGYLVYDEGHKIDIDCGCFFSGQACLLNLDTLEPTYFYVDNKKS